MTTKNIKYWLEEKELKTPEHDKMVLWSFENAKKILDDLNFLEGDYFHYFKGLNPKLGNWDWKKGEYIILDDLSDDEIKEFEDGKKEVEQNYEKFLQDTVINRKKIHDGWKGEMIKKHIEYSIPNQYYLGFTDLMFELMFFSYNSKYFSLERRKNEKNPLYDLEENFIYLEIKPRILSIGETMRQINYYKKALENQEAIFIIVTKTKGLKEIFKSQGVLVYEYNEISESQKTLKEKEVKNEK